MSKGPEASENSGPSCGIRAKSFLQLGDNAEKLPATSQVLPSDVRHGTWSGQTEKGQGTVAETANQTSTMWHPSDLVNHRRKDVYFRAKKRFLAMKSGWQTCKRLPDFVYL